MILVYLYHDLDLSMNFVLNGKLCRCKCSIEVNVQLNYLQQTVCKKMVCVHLLYDLDLRPGKLSSHFVRMVDFIVEMTKPIL